MAVALAFLSWFSASPGVFERFQFKFNYWLRIFCLFRRQDLFIDIKNDDTVSLIIVPVLAADLSLISYKLLAQFQDHRKPDR